MKNKYRNLYIYTCSVFCVLVLSGCGILSSDDFPGPPPGAGDLNINGIAYEQEDYDLFSRYILGDFPISPQFDLDESVARTDVNGDGASLTIADFVYFRNVINGSAVDPQKLNHSRFGTALTLDSGFYTASKPLGGLAFETIGGRNFNADTVINDIHYYSADNLYNGRRIVIVLPESSGVIPAGTGIDIGGWLVSVKASSPEGATVAPTVSLDYPAIVILGNFPDPVFSETKIEFIVRRPFGYTLEVRNSAGQLVVHNENSSTEMGFIQHDITLGHLSEGVYFYTVRVGEESASGKMILQK